MGYRTTHATDSLVRYQWGVEIAMASVLRYTDAPFTISYGGNSYSPNYKLTFSGVGQSDQGLQRGTLTISNGDGTLGVLAAALSGRYRNPEVTLYEWWFSASDLTSTTIQETIVLMNGRLESPSWDREEITFALSPLASSLAGNAPHRAYHAICPLKSDFKGEQCGATTNSYSSCNGSFSDCTLRSNTSRFGGMRHVPKDGQQFYFGAEGSFIIGPPVYPADPNGNW